MSVSGIDGSSRVTSVDTLRGLTILLMIFVNDLGPGAPSWMHHIQPPNADGLTLAWWVIPRELGWKRYSLIGLKLFGILGLIVLLAIYRREPGPAEIPFWGTVSDWRWLRIGWWGILGLIGWAYLTVSLIMLVLGRRREWLVGSLAILILLHLAMRHGGLFAR